MKKNKIIAITVAILSCMSISSIGVSAESSTITTNSYSKNDVLLTDTFGFNTVKGSTIMLSGKCGDNATWTLDTDMTLTISGTGNMYDYANEKSVPWYDYKNNINYINIESTITSIGDYTFCGCSSLTGCYIDLSSVKRIGKYSFAGVNFDAIDLYNCQNLVTIDEGAFRSCSYLQEINISQCNKLVSIGDYAFTGCKIKRINFPNSLTSIGYCCFYNDYGQLSSSIILPSNETPLSIGYYSIGVNASPLSSDTTSCALIIPPKVTTIDTGILSGINGKNKFVVFGEEGTQAQFFAVLNGYGFIATEFDENGKPMRSIEELEELAYYKSMGYPITTEPLVTTEPTVTTTTPSTTEVPIDDGKIYDNCDCNRDGKVNTLDLIYIKRRLFELM